MKKLILMFLMFQSFNLLAQEAPCVDQKFVDQKTEKFTADICKASAEAALCADAPKSSQNSTVDMDAMKKNISNLFDMTEKNQWKKLQSERGPENKRVNPFYFGAGDVNEQIKKKSDYAPEHILDWYTKNTKPVVTKDAARESITKEYLAYAKAENCKPMIHTDESPHDYKGVAGLGRSEDEISKEQKSPEYQKEKENFYLAKNQKRKYGLQSPLCEIGPKGIINRPRVKSDEISCSGNLTAFYPDNKWNFNSSNIEKNLDTPETQELQKCIKKLEATGAKIKKVIVSSSASQLRNSSEINQQFCGDPFNGLSKARGDDVKNNFLPKFFGFSRSQIVVKPDGARGPCPYEDVNGQKVLKALYATPEDRKSLDEYKKVEVRVIFSKSDVQWSLVPSLNPEKEYKDEVNCKSVHFTCYPNE
jgi:hypothetical protein